MDKDYFLNHELVDDIPLLHLAFCNPNNESQNNINKANKKALELVFEKITKNKCFE